MPSLDEMMGDLHTADAAGDTQLAQHIAGLIKAQQHGQIEGEPDLGGVGNAMLGAGLGFVHNLPLVGDAAITAGRWANDQMNGRRTSWQQANDEAHQTISSATQQHPVTSALGGVAGAVDAGVVGGAALKAVAPGAAAALALRSGPVAANVARIAAVGALGGAAQGGGEHLAGGDVAGAPGAAVQDAALGAATAVGTAGLGRAGLAVGRRFAPLSSKTAVALSRVFGENPADLQTTWQNHLDATGRVPSMAEMASYKQQGVIRGLAKDSATLSDRLQQNAETAALQRSQDMQARFAIDDQGRPLAASPQDFTNYQGRQGDVDYGAARQHTFDIPTEESADLGGVSPADHIAAEILPQAGLGKADRVRIMSGLQSGQLTGQDAQLIRSGLSESLSKNYSPAVKGLLSDFDSIAGGPGNEEANAALHTATANFAANARRVEGAQQGSGVLGSTTPNSYAATAAANAARGPEFAQGMAAGANDALGAASATPRGATTLVQRLATDDNLNAKLVTTLGQPAADALRRAGAAETRAALAMHNISSPTPAAENDSSVLKDAAQIGAAVASHGITWKLYHGLQVFAGAKMSASVQAKVADYLTDPTLAPAAYNLLAKAGVSAQRLRHIALSVAAASGILTADASPYSPESPQ